MKVAIMKIGKDRNREISLGLKTSPVIDETGLHVVVQGFGSALDTLVEISIEIEDIKYLQQLDLTKFP